MMRDKRIVDELSIDELERVLTLRRREERLERMARMQRTGRVVSGPEATGKQHPSAASVMAASAQSGPVIVSGPAQLAAGGAPRFVDGAEVASDLSIAERDRFWKSFLNKLLLLIEVAAIVGVLYLGYNLFLSIGTLEHETAEAQRMAEEQRAAALPTLAPTPEMRIEQVVLPGGHTPPTSPHGAQPNLNEIPANLQPLVQAQLFQPVINRAPQTPQTALRVIIPKLNLDQTIVQGTDWEALKQGVGQLQNGVNPGDKSGNLVLNAHNDIYGELFRYLDQLEPGDRFQIQTQTDIYTYEVTGSQVVEPSAVEVMYPTENPTATLISCYPYQVDTHRIVVFANRLEDF